MELRLSFKFFVKAPITFQEICLLSRVQTLFKKHFLKTALHKLIEFEALDRKWEAQKSQEAKSVAGQRNSTREKEYKTCPDPREGERGFLCLSEAFEAHALGVFFLISSFTSIPVMASTLVLVACVRFSSLLSEVP